jgi:polysaccharide biosynthesis transport protein
MNNQQDLLQGESDGLSAREVYRTLSRQRRVIVICVGIALIIGIAAAAAQQQSYSAFASIRVDERRQGLPTLDARAANATVTGNEIGAEIEVLKSRLLAGGVVDSLRLQMQVVEPPSTRRDDLFSFIELERNAQPHRYQFSVLGSNQVRVERLDAAGGGVPARLKERVNSVLGRGSDAGAASAGRVFGTSDTITLAGAKLLLSPAATDLDEFLISITSWDAAVTSLSERLKVRQPARDAGIVRIEYKGRDPKLVREVPHALATRFIATRRSTQQTEVRSTIDFLRYQLDSIGTQLTATEYELQTFRETNRVVDLQAEGRSQVQRLAELQAERGALESERSALSQLVAEARAASVDRPAGSQSPYRRLVAFPAILRSSAASEMIRSLGRLEDERAALMTRRQPNDPDVRALTARIEQLEGEFQATVLTYLEGLNSQIRSADGQLGQYQREASRIPQKEARFARLSRQARLQDEIYSTLKSRLTEAEVLHAVEDPSVRIVDVTPATVQPVGTKRAMILLASGFIGIIFGSAAAFVRELRDGSVRSRADLQVAAGVPVLGLIPRVGNAEEERLRLPSRTQSGSFKRLESKSGKHQRVSIVPTGETVPATSIPLLSGRTRISMIAAEAYRRLHLNMLRARPGVSTRVFLISSPLPGDGKTTTAANLAITLSQRGYRVVLVDADLRQGPLARLFNAEPGPTLADLLSRGTQPDSWETYTRNVLRSMNGARDTGLDLVPAGKSGIDAAVLLGSPRLPEFISWLRSKYDIIIIDSPPAAIVTDAATIAAHVDGTILVARSGVTPFDALQYAASQFHASQVPVLGTVLNDIPLEGETRDDSGFRWYEYGKSYFTPTAGPAPGRPPAEAHDGGSVAAGERGFAQSVPSGRDGGQS